MFSVCSFCHLPDKEELVRILTEKQVRKNAYAQALVSRLIRSRAMAAGRYCARKKPPAQESVRMRYARQDAWREPGNGV
jgi:hypothetical protein